MTAAASCVTHDWLPTDSSKEHSNGLTCIMVVCKKGLHRWHCVPGQSRVTTNRLYGTSAEACIDAQPLEAMHPCLPARSCGPHNIYGATVAQCLGWQPIGVSMAWQHACHPWHVTSQAQAVCVSLRGECTTPKDSSCKLSCKSHAWQLWHGAEDRPSVSSPDHEMTDSQ